MDTGIGRDGYSVVGQGKIDEILSSKSEDRRHIFEEAAGISTVSYTHLASFDGVSDDKMAIAPFAPTPETDMRSSNILSSSCDEKPYKSIIPSLMYRYV